MRRKAACATTLIGFLILSVASSLASAETVVINYTDRGWYKETGQHVSSNTNYIVGDYRATGCTTACGSDFRNFFVFDLSSLPKPIASGTLALLVPNPTRALGYSSPDPSENYELHDVVTPIATLVAGSSGASGVPAHADLGSGVVYGNRAMTAADIGKIVEITLNSSAIAAMNSTHGLFGIGGSLTTLDGVANNEFVFAGSNSGSETTQLRLTLVPEPTTVVLCVTAVFATQLRRQRRRSQGK